MITNSTANAVNVLANTSSFADSMKQQYETLMSNIATSKNLHNLPKKELNAIGTELGLTGLKKHEMVNSIVVKLVSLVILSSLEMPSHPAVEKIPIVKEIIKSFLDQLSYSTGAAASSLYQQPITNQLLQQSQQQSQQPLYLQALEQQYGATALGFSQQQSNQLYMNLMYQANQQMMNSSNPSNQSQIQQMLQYLQYGGAPTGVSATASGLPTELSGLSSTTQQQQSQQQQSLSQQQQQLQYYAQYLQSDPVFSQLPLVQQQQILLNFYQQQTLQRSPLQQYLQNDPTQLMQIQQQQSQLLQSQLQQQQLLQLSSLPSNLLSSVTGLSGIAATMADSIGIQSSINPVGSEKELAEGKCICHSSEKLTRERLSKKDNSGNSANINDTVACVECKHEFHSVCVRVNLGTEQARIFECPSCTLKKMDPLNRVVEIIVRPTLISGQGHVTAVDVSTEVYNMLGRKNHAVEIRCVRIDGTRNMYETTWPDMGECELNGSKLKEFVPLQSNSSLKKRKDEKFTLRDVSIFQKGANRFRIKENHYQPTKENQFRIDANAVHVVAIVLVKKITHAELIKNIPQLGEEESKEFIRNVFVQGKKKTQKEKQALESDGANGGSVEIAVEKKNDQEEQQKKEGESQMEIEKEGEVKENTSGGGEDKVEKKDEENEKESSKVEEKVPTEEQNEIKDENQVAAGESSKQQPEKVDPAVAASEIQPEQSIPAGETATPHVEEKTAGNVNNAIEIEGEENDELEDGVHINQLNVSLVCSFGFNTIKTPARGRYCRHVQCFSLENMLVFSEAILPRKWRCPICKIKCYEMVVDTYYKSIISSYEEQNQKVIEIAFDKDANYSINKLKGESDDEEDEEERKQYQWWQATRQAGETAAAAAAAAGVSTAAGEKDQKAVAATESTAIVTEENPEAGGVNDKKANVATASADAVVILDEDDVIVERDVNPSQENGENGNKSGAENQLSNGNGTTTNGTESGAATAVSQADLAEQLQKKKDKLKQSLEYSQNVYSDDLTFEDFSANSDSNTSTTPKILDYKLKSLAKSCRSKISKNLKKHFPDLVNLIKKDTPASLIAVQVEQLEQQAQIKKSSYSNSSMLLGSSANPLKESSKSSSNQLSTKNLNAASLLKQAASGIHSQGNSHLGNLVNASASMVQLPTSTAGYSSFDLLGAAQGLIPSFSSNAYNLFSQRNNGSTFNFMPMTSNTNGSTNGSAATATGASNAQTAQSQTSVLGNNANSLAAQYLSMLDQTDISNVLSQLYGIGTTTAATTSQNFYGLGGAATSALPTSQLSSALGSTDPATLYSQYMSGFYGNIMGAGGATGVANTPNYLLQAQQQQQQASLIGDQQTAAVVAAMQQGLSGATTIQTKKSKNPMAPKKKAIQKQAGGSAGAGGLKAGGVATGTKVGSAPQQLDSSVVVPLNKGKADDPICLEDD